MKCGAAPQAGSAAISNRPAQGDLFGAPEATANNPLVRPATSGAEYRDCAKQLPESLYLGTSSWAFPGWSSLVYEGTYTEAALARHGLAAYAQHPLLRSVGVDRSFYAPVPVAQWQRYAQQVPDAFRFVVKAYAGLTTAPEARRPSYLQGAPAAYLDASFATQHVVEPACEGLGAALGAFVFQFSPQGPARTSRPQEFHAALHEFLRGLPRGPLYAVELRDRELLGPDYEAVLRDVGAVHCHNVHPRMPSIDAQTLAAPTQPLVVRWMLFGDQQYEAARERYAPFNELIDPDLLNRARIGKLVLAAIARGQPVFVIANNKAEGSAPKTLIELAKWLIQQAPATSGCGA
jgi:uncharacterized protein YecE (DUF72 family)